MTKDLIRIEVNGIYSRKRAKAIAIANSFYEKALANEEFRNVDKKIKDLTFDIAKNKAFDIACDEQEKELQTVENQRIEILKRIGIDPKSLEPQYECKICNDTGFVNGQTCECMTKTITRLALEKSGLGGRTLHSFVEFDANVGKTSEQVEELEKLRDLFEKLVVKFPNTKNKIFVICGKPGVGKTFAVECVANELIKKGFSTLFLTSFEFNSQLLKYHTCFDFQKQSYLDAVLDPELLIVDDLGTEPVLKNVTLEYLYLVITERVLRGKHTIFTSNLLLNDLYERYAGRVASRLTDKSNSITINLHGENLRLK